MSYVTRKNYIKPIEVDCSLDSIFTPAFKRNMAGDSPVLEIPLIILEQEPIEEFSLKFSILQRSVSSHSPRQYKLILTFRNFLHVFCKNNAYHRYDILCTILTENNKIVPLFIHESLSRRAQEIYIIDEFLISDEVLAKSLRILFKISRSPGVEFMFNLAAPLHAILHKMENESDITIEVENKSFPVHRCILSSKSDVFKSMCTTRMSENLKSIIKIEDFSPEIIEEMLMYIYTGKCQNIRKHSRELFKVAHKYDLKKLQIMCEEYFLFDLNTENVIDFNEIANLYNLNYLKEGLKNFMKENERELVEKEDYQNYLGGNLNQESLIYTLNVMVKYDLKFLKSHVMRYVNNHKKDIVGNKEFFQFLKNNPELMEEIFVNIISQ